MSELPGFKAIAAIDRSRGLGKGGDLPWHLPEDLKHFARTTKYTIDPTRQNAVIMGRVTCESVPAMYWPLVGRRNVVITRNPQFQAEGAEVVASLEEALGLVGGQVETIYVVGGGQIYELAVTLPACHELILTRIDEEYDCDAFFPAYHDRFRLEEELQRGEHEGTRYVIERWIRNAS